MAAISGQASGMSVSDHIENKENDPIASGLTWQDPRMIIIPRTDAGFGFILRHFIVYPPENSAQETERSTDDPQSKRIKSSSQQEAMDTIFVIHVKDDGPADNAGLQEGDRILSVNGQSVAGKTYAQVIALIQASDSSLQLRVVPKNEDILQVAYQTSAYNQALDAFRGSASNIPQPPVVSSPPSQDYPVEPSSRRSSRFRSEVRFASVDKDIDDDGGASPVEEPQCCSTAQSFSLSSAFSGTGFQTSGDGGSLAIDISQEPGENNAKTFTSSVTWPRRSSKTDDARKSNVTNGPPTPVRTTSKNISLSHLQRPEANSESMESLSKSSKSSSDSSGSRSVDVRLRHTDSNDNLNQSQENLTIPLTRDSTNRWSAPEEQHTIRQYKESLRKSQEDIFGASRGKPSVLSKSVTTGQLQLSGVSSAPTSPHRPSIPYTKSLTTSSLLSTNKYYDLETDGTSVENNQPVSAVTVGAQTTQTFTTTTFTTSTGMYTTVSTTSVNVNPLGIRFLPAYSGRPTTPHPQPQIIVRRRKSYDNVLDEKPRPKGALHRIHENILSDSNVLPQRRIPVKVHDSGSPSHVMQIEKVHGAGGVSITVKGTPYPSVQETPNQGANRLVDKRRRQFEDGTSDSSPSTESVRHQFELRKLATSAAVDSVAQKAAQFENLQNGDQSSRKISIQIRKNRDPVRLQSEKQYVSDQEPPPKTPVRLQNDPFKVILEQPSYETSKRITLGPSLDSRSKSTSYLSEDSYDGGPVIRQQSYSSVFTPHDRYIRQSSEERSPQLYPQNESSMFTTSYSMSNMSSSSVSSSLSPPHISASLPTVPKVEHAGMSSLDDSPMSPPVSEQNVSSVTLRTKPKDDDNDVKLFRRISYLKATAKDRGHLSLPVDPNYEGDVNAEDTNLADQPTTPTKTSIKKLKAFFGERTPKIVEASERKAFTDLPTPPGDVSREGALYLKMAVVDGRRASDRSWKLVWCVLCQHLLYFYRERKDSQSNTHVVCDELPISVKGSTVDIAHGYTKRKNVLRLSTQNNCEYLLQADDHDVMMQWIQALQAGGVLHEEEEQALKSQSNLIVKKSCQYEQSAKMSPIPPSKSAVKKIAALSSFRAKSPGHSPGIRLRKDDSPKVKETKEVKTWKGKVVKSFKRLGSASDTLALAHGEHEESEEEIGMSFGVPLVMCPSSTFSENVPFVLELCTTVIEAKALDYTGIYRIPGNSATVSMLQEELNKGIDQIDVENEKWLDVNAVGSLLKSFFRQLPDPLIPYDLYHVFIQANRNENPEKRMLNLKRLLHELPETHFETFKYLAQHLKTVALHGLVNKMDSKNLAIVFGPTLIRNVTEDRVAMVADMSDQCRIIESIIHHNEWFFSSWDVDNEVPVDESDDHPPAAVTQTTVPDDDLDGMNLKALVANIVQAANKKLRERDQKGLANVPEKPTTVEGIFGERNIDEEIEKRKKAQVEAAVVVTTAPTTATNEYKNTREGIFTAKMVFLQGRQASESSLRTNSEDVLSDPGLVSSQSTQSFMNRYNRFPSVGHLASSENKFSRRHSEEIVLDRRDCGVGMSLPEKVDLKLNAQDQKASSDVPSRMLKREVESLRESEQRVLAKQWVEKELQKTQEELEEDEDCLEDFIGNTNKISRKISDFTSKMTDASGRSDSISITSDYSTMSSTKEPAMLGNNSDGSTSSSPPTSVDKLPVTPPAKPRSHSLTNLNTSSNDSDPDLEGGKFFAIKIQPKDDDQVIPSKASPERRSEGKEEHDARRARRKKKGEGSVKTVNWKVGGEEFSPDDVKEEKASGLARSSSLRRGSLDSLRDFYEKNEFTASFASSSSEDGCDLLTSLTTTFDQKLRILLDPKYKLETANGCSPPGGVGAAATRRDESPVRRVKDVNSNSVSVEDRGELHKARVFRDPSLHRLSSDSKIGIASRFERPDQRPDPVEAAIAKQIREVGIASEGRQPRMGKVKAFVTKIEKSDTKKCSDEPSKIKPLSETPVITDRGEPVKTKAKCKSASPPVRRRNTERIKKRRHTVGGVHDFEDIMPLIRSQKYHRKTSAWDRLQPGLKSTDIVSQERTLQSWIQQERLRSSSSDVSQASSDGRNGKKVTSDTTA